MPRKKSSVKGICQICGKKSSQNANNRIQKHKYKTWKTNDVCLGSGHFSLVYSNSRILEYIDMLDIMIVNVGRKIIEAEEGGIVQFLHRTYRQGRQHIDQYIPLNEELFEEKYIENPALFDHLVEPTFESIRNQYYARLDSMINEYNREKYRCNKLMKEYWPE